jgi:hypothetical protein
MTTYRFRIYNLGRVQWLIFFVFLGIVSIMIPIGLLTRDLTNAIIPLVVFAVICIWLYYYVCCAKTEWTNTDEGVSISAPEPNRFFAFDEVFIRWDDITGHDESSVTIIRGIRYLKFEVFTYSGNDIELHTPDFNELPKFIKDFSSYASAKSPYLQAIASK